MARCGLTAFPWRPVRFLFKRSPDSLEELCRLHRPFAQTATSHFLVGRSLSRHLPCVSGGGGRDRTENLVQTTFGLEKRRWKWLGGSVNGFNFRQNSSESNSNGPWYVRSPPTTGMQRHDPTALGGVRKEMGKESKLRQTSLKLKETREKVKEKMEEMIDKENIFTIPNLLSVTRIGLSPVLGYLVLQHSYHYALGIFVFAGVTDLLDGLIARHFPSQQSMIGSFLDPMADKLLIALLFLSLTATELIPVSLTALIIARDMCLMYAGFYIRYWSLPPPKTFSRYFNATFATAKLSPTLSSKINTSVQLTLVACTLAAPVFDLVNHPYLQTLWYVTAATTIFSGLSYVGSQNTFEMLREAKEEKVPGRTSSETKDT